MAVSSDYSFELDRAGIIKNALQICGVLAGGGAPSTGDTEMGSDFLNAAVKALQKEGLIVSTLERTSLSLASGATAAQSLPADTLTVHFPIMARKAGETTDTQVERLTVEEYDQISSKATTGRPSLALLQRPLIPTLTFWPVPDSAYTIYYARTRFLRDIDAGTTPDLRSQNAELLTLMVAYKLSHAKNLPPSKRAELRAWLKEEKKTTIGAEQEDADLQFTLR